MEDNDTIYIMVNDGDNFVNATMKLKNENAYYEISLYFDDSEAVNYIVSGEIEKNTYKSTTRLIPSEARTMEGNVDLLKFTDANSLSEIPSNFVPIAMDTLKIFLNKSDLNITIADLGFEAYEQ